MADRPTASTVEPLWRAKTRPTEGGCLLWTGGFDGKWQVPYMNHAGRKHLARRVAWLIHHGEWPPHKVTTTCGTTGCVAPEHLTAQTIRPELRGAAASRRRDLEGRFWEKVRRAEPSACWLWTGSMMSSGYGRISRGSRSEGAISAHRLSYQIANGPIPDGLVVRHRCDNRVCVNPSHLELGTHMDNTQDRVHRRRSARQAGEQHGGARLTEAAVREIRRLAARGTPQSAVARQFDISQQTVSDLVNHRRWRHLA